MPLTQVQAGMMDSTAQYYSFKNRIINGAMVIDQRNAGASVTANDDVLPVDRWKFGMTQTSKGTAQQSTIAPTGFINSLLFTSSSAYSVLASDSFIIRQLIEGFNTADFAWGTANAATVTLSFWVRSSLTGSFGVVIANNGQNRCYPILYTINAANTWEQKSITIPGDTTGTWLTNNSVGVRVTFGLGVGSTFSAASGAWASGTITGVTGATSVVGTNGATFYITGVQLEKGSTATSFDYRPYGTELQLCQRYFYAPMQANIGDTTAAIGMGMGYNATNIFGTVLFPVTMRATPTAASSGSGTLQWSQGGASYNTTSAINLQEASPFCFTYNFTVTTATANAAGWFRRNSATGYVNFSAEL